MNNRSEKTAPTEPIACPFNCDASVSVWGQRSGRLIYECSSCHVVFFDRKTLPPPGYDHYYDYAKTWDKDRVFYELKIRRRALEKQVNRLRSLTPGRKLLDIGAGPGYFCKIAVERGFDVTAVDVNPTSVELGRKYFGVTYGDLEKLQQNEFDVIGCFHILEHIVDPASFLKKLRSKIKPGGVLVIHVPHREPLTYWMRNCARLGRAEDKLCALYAPEHISGFVRGSLQVSVERSGFRLIRSFNVNMWSMYYDPFFLRNYLETKNWVGILKKTLRHLVENVGSLFGRGDWIVAYFRAE